VVEYIIRAGTRPDRFLERCLASLREQSHRPLSVIVVPVVPSSAGCGDGEPQEVLRRYQSDFASFRVLPPQPAGVRSHALWAGLRAVAAPYFAILDDDDRLHPNHVASVMEMLREKPDVSLVHSGGIRVEEEEGFWEDEPHLRDVAGALIGENRRLEHFATVDPRALFDGEQLFLSHSWIARRELLDERILQDPNLPVLEDQYLHYLLFLKGKIAFTFRPTAEWNRRSASRDNALFEEKAIADCRQHIHLRLQFLPGFEAIRRQEEPVRDLQRELREVRQNLQAFEWIRSPEMLALQRSTEFLLQLRGLKRWLRDGKARRGRAPGGHRTEDEKGLRGFLNRMASLGRE
jgi:hypothetical protein